MTFEVPFDVKSGRKTAFGKVYQCNFCGLKLVNPPPEADEIPAHYELPKYYTHGTGHIPERQPTLAERVVVHLAWRSDFGKELNPADLLGPQGGRRSVLDIGCGAGNLLSAFSEMNMETIGVDPDKDARLQAEKRGHRVYSGTAEAMPEELANQKFDIVLMTHVLEHCQNPTKALENARKFLSQDGILYCEVPNAGSLYFETYGQISEMLDVPRHLFFFRKDDLELLADKVGLQITEWKYHGLTRHFLAPWKHWENSIFDRLVKAGGELRSSRRSIFGDLMLLSSGVLMPRKRRYDSIGFVARGNP